MDDCFHKGLLKRIPPDMENAIRSLNLSMSNIEDAAENFSIHRKLTVSQKSLPSSDGCIFPDALESDD